MRMRDGHNWIRIFVGVDTVDPEAPAFVFLHAFYKTTPRWPAREISEAEARWKIYLNRK